MGENYINFDEIKAIYIPKKYQSGAPINLLA